MQIRGEKVGMMVSRELMPVLGRAGHRPWSVAGNLYGEPSSFPRDRGNIYRCLRELDELDITKIIMEGVPRAGLGLAIMNRLEKAAAHCILET